MHFSPFSFLFPIRFRIDDLNKCIQNALAWTRTPHLTLTVIELRCKDAHILCRPKQYICLMIGDFVGTESSHPFTMYRLTLVNFEFKETHIESYYEFDVDNAHFILSTIAVWCRTMACHTTDILSRGWLMVRPCSIFLSQNCSFFIHIL